MNGTSIFQYFVIAGLINTTLFAFLLLTKKKNTTASFLLIAFMLLFSFQALLNAFDTRSFFLANPHLSRISWLLPSLFGPLVYLFTKKLTTGEQRLRAGDWLHFIPFVFYFLTLSNWFFKPGFEKRALLDDFEGLSRHDFGWLNQLSLLLILFYLLLTLKQIRNYRFVIENTFSEISSLRLDWLQKFVYIILIIFVISAMGFYGRKWDIPFLTNFYHYNYALIVLLIYWLAYKCITQPELLDIQARNLKYDLPAATLKPVPFTPVTESDLKEKATVAAPVVPAKKYVKSGLDAETAAFLYNKLLIHMENEKPYLEPELNIYKLSEQINTSRHHLSQVINETSGKSFFDFINSYRVEEVKAKLSNPEYENKSILGIALDSGFNSKATFNTAFKKHTGMTPSAYQQSLK